MASEEGTKGRREVEGEVMGTNRTLIPISLKSWTKLAQLKPTPFSA